MFACRSLLTSGLADHVDWLTVDSTQRSQPPPSFVVRAWRAIGRVSRVAWAVLFRRVDHVLIFSAGGVGLLEKSLMARIALARGLGVALSFRSEVLPLSNRLAHLFVTGVFKRIQILCQSEAARDAFVLHYGLDLDRLRVVPNWIDTEIYAPTNRQEGNDTNPAVRVLYAGWIEDSKGVFDLLEAARRLDRDDYRLRFVGGGSRLSDLKQQVESTDLSAEIDVAGWVPADSMADELGRADILVLPSYSEGMPNAVLQAMAAGLPVVATSVGGIPELIGDTAAGILVAPGEVDELADALDRLIQSEELRASFGQNGRKAAVTRHSIDVAWPAVAAALGIAVGEKSGGI